MMMSERQYLREIEEKVDLYLRVKKYVPAYDILTRGIARHPEAANLNLLRGIVLHRQSKFSDAIKEFTTALNKNPDYLEASLNLCATLCDLGQYDEAEEIHRQIRERNRTRHSLPKVIRGKLANSHAVNGKAYKLAGLYQEAASEFRKALSLYEKMPDVKIELARIYMETDQTTKCRKELLETISIDPANHEALTLLGILSYKNGEMDIARDYLKKAKELDPNGSLPKAFLRICQSNLEPA